MVSRLWLPLPTRSGSHRGSKQEDWNRLAARLFSIMLATILAAIFHTFACRHVFHLKYAVCTCQQERFLL